MSRSGAAENAEGGTERLSSRDRIIRTTCELLEKRGYHGTGISEIVRESGAPRGSVYYHFPGGKEQIVSEAVLFAGRTLAGRIRVNLALEADVVEAFRSFIMTIAHHVEASGFAAGGPLMIVAAETASTSGLMNTSCSEAYSLMHASFAERLREGGCGEQAAAALATSIMAAVEGAIVLSRAAHSGEPLRTVAGSVELLIRDATGRKTGG